MTEHLYLAMMFAGVVATAICWSRLIRRDRRLLVVYAAAFVGSFVGAKLLFLLAEGWRYLGRDDAWKYWVTGKTVLGALLGGYAAVEATKRLVGYTKPTGDWFAIIVPLGLVFGRIGCWSSGCCRGIACAPAPYTLTTSTGVSRWPAVPAELLFNVVTLAVLLRWYRQRRYKGQLFHIYLITYGGFRLVHEFLRERVEIVGPLSGYHLGALAVMLLGIVRYRQRLGEGSAGR